MLKYFISTIYLVIFISLFSSCINSQQVNATIRDIDFNNFTYNISCGDADTRSPITLKNGKFNGNKYSPQNEDYNKNIKVFLNIYDVKFGDLNRDNKDEAIILYMCGSGASYAYFRGLIFTLEKDKPVLVIELEGGNKGDGGFHKVEIVNNLLIIERYQLSEAAGSPCCPKSIETIKYKLEENKLIQVSTPVSRKIPDSN